MIGPYLINAMTLSGWAIPAGISSADSNGSPVGIGNCCVIGFIVVTGEVNDPD